MGQLFRPGANTIAKAGILVFLAAITGLGWALTELNRSPFFTKVGVPQDQPVPFSHKHHVADIGIDCRYCHTSVEESNTAGLPPTQTCMNCHSQIWTEAPMLEPVRESFKSGKSLEWIRVHNVPDFVYFNHSIHIQKGIGCTTCHGQVDEMPLIRKGSTLFMEWCLSCHREPEKFIRPKDQVFNVHWKTPADQLEQGRKLVDEYNIKRKTDCSVCHR